MLFKDVPIGEEFSGIAFVCDHEKGYCSGYCEWKNIRSDKSLEILKKEGVKKLGQYRDIADKYDSNI